MTVVEQQPHVLPGIDAEMADFVQTELEQNGVEVLLNTAVSSFIGETLMTDITSTIVQKIQGQAGRRLRVRDVVTDKGTLPADIVIMGIILIGIIGYGIDILMRQAEKWLVPWKGRV